MADAERTAHVFKNLRQEVQDWVYRELYKRDAHDGLAFLGAMEQRLHAFDSARDINTHLRQYLRIQLAAEVGKLLREHGFWIDDVLQDPAFALEFLRVCEGRIDAKGYDEHEHYVQFRLRWYARLRRSYHHL